MTNKPTRCIDPVIKYCQDCRWGYESYPEWVETTEDLSWCSIQSGCILGFDQSRPEDEPTAEELKEFEEMCDKLKSEYSTTCEFFDVCGGQDCRVCYEYSMLAYDFR